MTLNRLIKGCKKQDPKCQKAIYVHYSHFAMNLSLRYTQDDHQAKDVVQNAFVKIFTKIDLFDPAKGSFEAWITRIVINEALQLSRMNKKFYLNGEDLSSLESEVDPSVLDKLHAEDILKLIRKLPDGYRLVFCLSVIEEFKHQEIAEILGITKSTSRSQLARAKKMLRELITKQNALANGKKIIG